MKIGIVAPSALPFMVGGAERLWWGLLDYLNKQTPHQADIIKLPTPEFDFWSLMESYEHFSKLDLSGFDLVISGKYPAWMVNHPRHVCYMLHRLRGLYDAYGGGLLKEAEMKAHPRTAALLRILRRSDPGREVLPELFGQLHSIKNEFAPDDELLRFPGPLAKAVVHFLDGIALSPGHIAKFAAISGTVAGRQDYFPRGVDVAVAYPPSNLTLAPTAPSGQYLFTASRLDHTKRVGLLIEAMRYVDSDTELRIAGTGPELHRLATEAHADPRIKLLGYRSDEELVRLYEGALAVPFVPYDEDYGLITVEAMMAGKPVITTLDSGGPCELVSDGKSGRVVPADAQAIAVAIRSTIQDPEHCASMGRAARAFAQTITWESVAQKLLAPASGQRRPAAGPVAARSKPKLAVVSPFPIFPPRHGGQSRVYHFYKALASWYDITIISLSLEASAGWQSQIASGLRELCVGKSALHWSVEQTIQAALGLPVSDIALAQLYRHTPEFGEAIRSATNDAIAVVACHPYVFPAIREVSAVPVWYEAQDVEAIIKEGVLPDNEGGRDWLDRVRAVEQSCCDDAAVVFACSQADADELARRYAVAPEKLLVVPNGADCYGVKFVGCSARQNMKERLGVRDTALAVFMGSGHWPNTNAVKSIFDIAAALPEVIFVVMGACCYAYDSALKPRNICFRWEVSEAERDVILSACDIALNPVTAGSGTNLKMLHYLAAGLPTVSTPVGARGLNLVDEVHALIREVGEFPNAIKSMLESDAETRESMRSAGRKHVEQHFDWRCIADSTFHAIERLSVSG